jgi:aspartate aminotransferase
MRQAFDERRKVILERIRSIARLSCPTPEGAFYVFVDISKTGLNSLEFCDRLLEQQQVAVIPGVAFGADGCIRLSYATDLTSIEKGIDRLAKFIESL